MLYANGNGVPRSYALAIRFACEMADRGGQNTAERIGRLEALRDGKPTANRTFDLCDEQMSGEWVPIAPTLTKRRPMWDACAGSRQARSSCQSARWRSFLSCKQPRTTFERARIQGEYTGGGGSGSAGFALEDQNLLREQFVMILRAFRKGRLAENDGGRPGAG